MEARFVSIVWKNKRFRTPISPGEWIFHHRDYRGSRLTVLSAMKALSEARWNAFAVSAVASPIHRTRKREFLGSNEATLTASSHERPRRWNGRRTGVKLPGHCLKRHDRSAFCRSQIQCGGKNRNWFAGPDSDRRLGRQRLWFRATVWTKARSGRPVRSRAVLMRIHLIMRIGGRGRGGIVQIQVIAARALGPRACEQ